MAPVLLGLRKTFVPPTPVTISARVNSNADSGTRVSWGGNYWGGPDGEPLYWQDAQGRLMWTNLRFTGLTIPRNATVTNAVIRLWSRDTLSAAAHKYNDVAVEQVNSATAITNSANFGSRMSNVGSSIRWTYPSTTTDQPITSPNLASIVQPIVNRAGWPDGTGGNIMFFTTTDTDSSATGWGADPQMQAYGSTGNSSLHPEIEITYEA